MAIVVKLPPQTDEEDPWLKDMNRLVARAELDRSKHQSRIADCYKYSMPWRHKFFSDQPGSDYDEVFDETVSIVLEDFAADMLNTFTPQKNNWLSEKPAQTYEADVLRQLKEPLEKRQAVVFAEMARSNLYQSLQESYLDLGPGTMILVVTDIDVNKPIHCESLPITDILLAKGPYGSVDPFRQRCYLRSEIKVLWPDADLSALGPEPVNGKDEPLEATDGCWRVWEDKGDETYRYAVRINGKLVYKKEYKGAGACPFIVAGWARDNTTAWRVGPTYRVLPAIKTLNQVRFLDLKNYDKHVDPPTSYEDDGVVNLDNGVTPGLWIPRAPGSEPPKAIESKARFDVAVFERDELRSVIRRAHYQDRPEQIGKTPPTATQWADEAAERARRMGTPATNLVQELQIPLYKRFVHLLEKRGKLPAIKVAGQDIALEPVSPLLRAQEQEEVVRMDKFAELIAARFGPQVAMIVIDIVKYANKMGLKLGIDSDLIRNEKTIGDAIQQLLPVLKATGAIPGSTPNVNVPPVIPGQQG
jgi:Bacteriophage head to tail connecting protein